MRTVVCERALSKAGPVAPLGDVHRARHQLLIFGASTVNLGQLLMSNARVLNEYGWQAAMDGALRQLAELVSTGYLGMAAYVVFKTCEHRLSDWLGHGR
jgi:hypothetical protein